MFSKIKTWVRTFHNHQFPRLKHVNGLLNYGISSFGWFNLVLGAALFAEAVQTTNFFLVRGVFDYSFWGTYFFLGGLGLLVGQFMNWWIATRTVLLALFCSKIIWLSALTWRQITIPESNPFLLLFFGLATILQFGMYLYFPVYKRIETWQR